MTNNSFIYNEDMITVFINGKTLQITSDSYQFEKVKDLLKQKDYEAIANLLDKAKAVETFSEGNFKIVEGRAYYKDLEINNSLIKRIMNAIVEGFDCKPFLKFLDNLMENPSSRSVNELYTFLEFNTLPITEDGHFLAYKKVASNFKDLYSGTIDNSVGKVVEMQRNQVNDDCNSTCSSGLHFASLSYMQHAGGDTPIVILKINPRDVVSIPSDYDNQKGRCCKYEVLCLHEGDSFTERFDKTVYASDGSDYNSDDEDESTDEFNTGHDDAIDDFAFDPEDPKYSSEDIPDDEDNNNYHYIRGYVDGWEEALIESEE